MIRWIWVYCGVGLNHHGRWWTTLLFSRSPSREQGGCLGCSRTRCKDIYGTVFEVSSGTVGMFLSSFCHILWCPSFLLPCSPSLRDDGNICIPLCVLHFVCRPLNRPRTSPRSGVYERYCHCTSREVNVARRPRTWSRPCELEEKKRTKTKSRRTQNTPASKCICLVLETPYGPASCYEHQRRYVRHGDCVTHRASVHPPPGLRGSEHMPRHPSCGCLPECSVSRAMATGVGPCALEAWKITDVGLVMLTIRLAWAVSSSCSVSYTHLTLPTIYSV